MGDGNCKNPSEQEEQPDPAQAGCPVAHCWALHTDFKWQRRKYPRLQKAVVVEEFLFPTRGARSVQGCWTNPPCSSLPGITAQGGQQGLMGEEAVRNGRRETGQPKSKALIFKGLLFVAN